MAIASNLFTKSKTQLTLIPVMESLTYYVGPLVAIWYFSSIAGLKVFDNIFLVEIVLMKQ